MNVNIDIKKTFGWTEITDEEILKAQEICAMFEEFAEKLLENMPANLYRDEVVKYLLIAEHLSFDAFLNR